MDALEDQRKINFLLEKKRPEKNENFDQVKKVVKKEPKPNKSKKEKIKKEKPVKKRRNCSSSSESSDSALEYSESDYETDRSESSLEDLPIKSEEKI